MERNISFLHFRKLSEKFSAFRQKISPGSSKLPSLAESRITFWGQLFLQNFFKIIFGLWVYFVSACLQKFSAWLSKLHSVYHRAIEEKQNCLRKKFLYFSNSDVNILGLLAEIFHSCCRNCILMSNWTLWEKCFLMRNFLLHFGRMS